MRTENVLKRNGKMKKYICPFCDERKYADTAHIIFGKIGICKDCFEALDKTKSTVPYQGTRSVKYVISPYEYSGKMRNVILAYKFNNCYAYAPLLAEMMKGFVDCYDIWEEFDYIIPIPLHKKRFAERGYNQSELIAKRISEHIHVPVKTDYVRRVRETKRQSLLDRISKMTNIKDAFECDADLTGKKILLFDDIYTTGSTIQACASALEKAGAKMICAMTLAIYIQEESSIYTY